MSWSQSAAGFAELMQKQSPEYRKEQKWKSEAKEMERQKFAATMQATRLANEKAESESDAMKSYKVMNEAEDAYRSVESLPMPQGPDAGGIRYKSQEKIKEVQAGLSPEAQQVFGGMMQEGGFEQYRVGKNRLEEHLDAAGLIERNLSQVAKLQSDLDAGRISQDVFDASLPKPPKQSTSEFERNVNWMVQNGHMSEAESVAVRKARANSQAKGEGGPVMVMGSDGTMTYMTDGSDIGKAEQRKQTKAYKDKLIARDRFTRSSNKMLDAVTATPESMGVVGALSRWGDNLKAEVRNVFSATGYKLAEGTSRNVNDYDFGNMGQIAGFSAKHKTATLSLALSYAAASGMGEGRALTDKDVQRAIDAVGGDTASVGQLASKLLFIQEELDAEAEITAKHYDFLEYSPSGYSAQDKYKHLTGQESDMPKVASQDDFDKLPAGAEYMEQSDDGQWVRYRKPK